MTTKNRKIWFICAFLSKYNEKGFLPLGYKNFSDAYRDIAKKFNSKKNSVRNIRDWFDPIFPNNGRRGWYQKGTAEQKLFYREEVEQKGLSYFEYLGRVIFLINTRNFPEENTINKTLPPDAPIASNNIKPKEAAEFLKYINENSHVYSFKMVFMLGCLTKTNTSGIIKKQDVTNYFSDFYIKRKQYMKSADRKKSLINKIDLCNQKQVLSFILKNPFNKFAKRGFIHYSKQKEEFYFNSSLWNQLTTQDLTSCIKKLQGFLSEYYSKI